jgi:hypothetical protein
VRALQAGPKPVPIIGMQHPLSLYEAFAGDVRWAICSTNAWPSCPGELRLSAVPDLYSAIAQSAAAKAASFADFLEEILRADRDARRARAREMFARVAASRQSRRSTASTSASKQGGWQALWKGRDDPDLEPDFQVVGSGLCRRLVANRSDARSAAPSFDLVVIQVESYRLKDKRGAELAWLNRNRHLAKSFEASLASAKAWLYLGYAQLRTRRLTRA